MLLPGTTTAPAKVTSWFQCASSVSVVDLSPALQKTTFVRSTKSISAEVDDAHFAHTGAHRWQNHAPSAGEPACGPRAAPMVLPSSRQTTRAQRILRPGQPTATKGSPTKRAAAPAIDVLDDDVLDNCLGFLDAEDELLRGPIRAVASGWRATAARCAKRSVHAVCARLAKLPGARRERHAKDAAKRLASLAGLPATHPQLNVAVALWFVDNQDGTGPLVDDAKVARQLWAFVDEVGDGAAVLNDAIDVWPHRVRAFAHEGRHQAAERSAFVGTCRSGAAAAKLRGAKRCDDACSTRRAIDAVFADVLQRGARAVDARAAAGRRLAPDGARGEDAPLLPRVRGAPRRRRRPRGDLLHRRASEPSTSRCSFRGPSWPSSRTGMRRTSPARLRGCARWTCPLPWPAGSWWTRTRRAIVLLGTWTSDQGVHGRS